MLSNTPQCGRKPLLFSMLCLIFDMILIIIWGNMSQIHTYTQGTTSSSWSIIVTDRCSPHSLMPFLTDTLAAANHNTILTIPSLHDIKEDMWSSTYSLKGKPFKLLLLRNHQQVCQAGTPSHYTHYAIQNQDRWFIIGMEHCAQTMLYTLVKESYSIQVPSGCWNSLFHTWYYLITSS